MSRLGHRIERVERDAGVGQPCWCVTNYIQFDDGSIVPDKKAPLCRHGRPWRPGKVYVLGGPPRDVDEVV